MGLHQITAVGNRRYRGDLLNEGYVEILTECVDRKIQIGKVFLGGKQSTALSREIHTRALKISKRAEITVKGFRSESLSHGHQPGVTGLLNSLGKGQRTVSQSLVTVDIVSRNGERTVAGQAFIDRNHSLFQCHRCGYDLEGRSGDICLGDRLVRPHPHQKLLFIIAVSVSTLRITRSNQLFDRLRIERPRVIQIEIGIDRNTENRARVDVHHNSRRAVLTARFQVRGSDLLLKRGLYEHIERCVNVISVLRGNVFLVRIRHFVTLCVTGGDVASVGTAEHIVVGIFESVKSAAVASRKTKHVRRQRRVRIVARIGGLQIHHILQTVFINKSSHQIGTILIDLLLNGTVEVSRMCRLLKHEFVAYVEN